MQEQPLAQPSAKASANEKASQGSIDDVPVVPANLSDEQTEDIRLRVRSQFMEKAASGELQEILMETGESTEAPALPLSSGELAQGAQAGPEYSADGAGLEDLRLQLRRGITDAITTSTLGDLLRKAWETGEQGKAQSPRHADDIAVVTVGSEPALASDSVVGQSEQQVLVAVEELEDAKTVGESRPGQREERVPTGYAQPQAPLSPPPPPPPPPAAPPPPTGPPPPVGDPQRGAWIPEVQSLREETVSLRQRTEQLETLLSKLLADNRSQGVHDSGQAGVTNPASQ